MIVVKRTKDDSLWLKHILGDPALVATLAAVPDGSRHTFDIGGRVGVFVKMRTSAKGKPTAGFKPDGEIKEWWQRSKFDADGTVAPFAYLGPVM